MLRKMLMAGSVSALAIAVPLSATETKAEPEYSQPVRNDVPRRLFWGDTHVHTNLSADAYSFGTTGHSPEMAYRFARGETVEAENGVRMKLRQPLDFIVISDHAEYLGIMAGAAAGDEAVLSSSLGRRAYDLFRLGKIADFITAVFGKFSINMTGGEVEDIEPEVRKSIWRGVAERADRFNSPGHFTAFVGYEYTSMPNLNNLHRNVIFRDDAARASQVLPFSAIDSRNPEDLWKFLAAYEDKTGGSVLAIPHNGNASGGMMFADTQFDGSAITAQYAKNRMRWEPLQEMTQIKGDGEAHPLLSPTDEFADYETWNALTEGASVSHMPDSELLPRLPGSYARYALMRGLEIEGRVGANPYKTGFIGSTDTHTALASAAEDNFSGKMGSGNPSATRWKDHWGPASNSGEIGDVIARQFRESGATVPVNWTSAASGLAAVWARENTREALFDAMRRKEVYATTGTRIGLRFFGGWNYPANADKRPDYADIGYEGGVPMGGDLTAASAGRKPQFIVVAAKDPDGANLDRVQIVKGWVGADGKAKERVFDVAWSGKRKRDPATGHVPPLGSTVDVKAATYANTIGAPLLSTTWSDPEFDPAQRAFYYVRVLEIPTPRWTAYDAAFFGITMSDNIPMTTQERAYSSPIWYTPEAQ